MGFVNDIILLLQKCMQEGFENSYIIKRIILYDVTSSDK